MTRLGDAADRFGMISTSVIERTEIVPGHRVIRINLQCIFVQDFCGFGIAGAFNDNRKVVSNRLARRVVLMSFAQDC